MVGIGLSRLSSYLEETDMSTREKLIKARMGMLALAEELQNISRPASAPASAAATTTRSRKRSRSTAPTAWPRGNDAGRGCRTRRRPSWSRRSSR